MRRNIYVAGLLIVFFVMYTPAVAHAFPDTHQHWARPTIDHLRQRNLINGYPDGTYAPDKNISRAEFVTLVINALNKSEEAKQLLKGRSHFTDVAGHWAMGYIEAAWELDIAHGDGRGHFEPLKLVSREEAVVMLTGSLGLGTELNDAPPAGFSDSADISPWARKAINYAVYKGLAHGYPDKRFRPGQYLTRAEVAVMLEQFLALQGQEFHFYGVLKKIDLPLKRAAVIIDGREEIFELSSNMVGYSEGRQQPLTQLELPLAAYFSLDREGKLAYFYAGGKNPSARISLHSTAAPDYEKVTPAAGAIVRLTEDLARGSSQPSLYHPEMSLAATSAAMRTPRFKAETGASGHGQLVALIDSGIDPGHPDLQTTGTGYRKIVDFIDLSDEGLVKLADAQPVDGYLRIDGRKVNVGHISNAADVYKYGYLNLGFLPGNFGLREEELLVVAVSSRDRDVFDAVYLDTDFDGQISDEVRLEEYSRQGRTVAINGENQRVFSLLPAEISSAGDYVKLGFDLLGHGTEVAGIVAARGKIQGVAPDAQLLPIKVMDRSGLTSLKKIESALSLAAERDAKIAVVSMGQYQVTPSELESFALLLANLRKVSDMLICVAAGNNGPGLGTVTGMAAMDNVVSVGAYATPEMWETDYGWEVESPTLWYFSSAGPAAGGAAAPLLLAPGSAVSTYPLWTGQPYRLDEGSSIAAPHLAGAAALLLDAGAHKLYIHDGRSVGRALLAGACPLAGYQAVEQGLGAVDLPRAWDELRAMRKNPAHLSGRQYSPGWGESRGFYARGVAPGELSLKVSNDGNEDEQVSVGGLASWIKPRQYTLQVPPHSERSVDIKYDGPQEPGLYSTFLLADKHDTPEWDVALLQTVVLPYELGKGFEERNELPAGQFKRYFFRIPEGTDSISFKLLAGDKGRVRMYVISPRGGQEVSPDAGAGLSQATAAVNMPYDQPTPGIWEVVVYSSATLSDYNLKVSQYTLRVTPDLKGKAPSRPPDNKYLITTVPPAFTPGEKSFLTLYFWYAGSKLPAAGLVSINDRLYEIKNGLVRLELEPREQEELNINVRW